MAAIPPLASAPTCTRLRKPSANALEEMRIKDARMRRLDPRRRPQYSPDERFTILQLRAARGWSAAETARRFLVGADTISDWAHRVDEQGPEALVRTPRPIHRYPDFLAAVAQQVKASAKVGRHRIAALLARAGVLLSASTVRRLLHRPADAPAPRPAPPRRKRFRQPANDTRTPRHRLRVTARYPHHVWHVDLTTIPIGPPGTGLWLPWFPFVLPLLWLFCWRLVVVVDHCSRSFLACQAFRQEPSADDLCRVLDLAVQRAGRAPRHIVSDQGSQFRADYLAWCRRHGVRPRFGAVGQHGSIAIVERFIRSLKDECLRLVYVSPVRASLMAQLDAYRLWYQEHRPHQALRGATPGEVLRGETPACQRPRFEVRPELARAQRRGRATARGDPDRRAREVVRGLRVVVTHVDDCPHLPVVELERAA